MFVRCNRERHKTSLTRLVRWSCAWQGWELVVEEHKPGLHYWAWRRPLRRGLYMVKSKTLYEGASPQQLLPFTFDMDFRKTWDENMNCQLPIPPPSACPPAAK